jgi:hypothetical protein
MSAVYGGQPLVWQFLFPHDPDTNNIILICFSYGSTWKWEK